MSLHSKLCRLYNASSFVCVHNYTSVLASKKRSVATLLQRHVFSLCVARTISSCNLLGWKQSDQISNNFSPFGREQSNFQFPRFLFAACFVYCSSFLKDDGEDPKLNSRIDSFGAALLEATIRGNKKELIKVINAIRNWDKTTQSSVLNYRHVLGWTPLMVAAINGNSVFVKLLLKAGADPNLGDSFNLHGVKMMTKMNAKILREEEFSPRLNPLSDFRGFTALHYAVVSNCNECVEALLNHDSDLLIKNHSGHTADEYCKRDNNQLAELLLSSRKKAVENRKIQEARERSLYPLEQRLKENIIGQEGAIATVSSAIRRKQNGWYDEDHPLVFLFLGSSGIGKTELAKQVARYLHKDNKQGFIRLDMSEYQEKHEVAKLIGSPPGYIGYDQGGQLTKQLRAQPNAVVLFDEVDKAHPDVLTVLLQLFDEGRLTDGQGKTIECKDAVFVMTSNLAAEEIAEYGAQLRQETKEQNRKRLQSDYRKTSSSDDEPAIAVVSRKFKEKVVRPILKRHFGRDEFLGRINEFVYFLPFSEDELFLLVERELKMWGKHARDRHGIKLSWKTPEVLTILADAYNIHYGARSLKYEVDRRVVGLLACAHERGLLQRGCTVLVENASPLNSVQPSLAYCRLQLHITSNDKKKTVLDEKDVFGNTGITNKIAMQL